MSIGLRVNGTKLTREFCPKCGDHAIFKSGVCCRTGCGHVLPSLASRYEPARQLRESTLKKRDAKAAWRIKQDLSAQAAIAKWREEEQA